MAGAVVDFNFGDGSDICDDCVRPVKSDKMNTTTREHARDAMLIIRRRIHTLNGVKKIIKMSLVPYENGFAVSVEIQGPLLIDYRPYMYSQGIPVIVINRGVDGSF